MYVRTVRSQVRPGKIDEAIRLITTTLNAPERKGFVMGLFGADEKTGNIIAGSVWTSKEAVDAFGEEAPKKLGDNTELQSIVISRSDPQISHVRSVTQPSRGGLFGQPKAARATTLTPMKGKEAEVDRIFEESVVPAARVQPGFRSMTYQEDEETGKRVVVALFDDEESLLASERSGYYKAQIEKVSHLLAEPAQREVMPIRYLVNGPLAVGYYKRLGMRVYDEVFNQGKMELIPELFTEDYEEKGPNLLPGLPTRGHESIRAAVNLFRSAFPDLHYEIQDIFLEGDTGIARVVMHGTHRGEFLGIPPSGKEVTVPAIDIARFRDGKIADHYGISDTMALLAQVGVAPPVGAQPVHS